METIAVLGATGGTGRYVVDTALQRGHRVIALVRQAGMFAPRDRLDEVVWPEATDVPVLAHALQGASVVISALGGAEKGPTTICTDGIRSAVDAMRTARVDRLIAVSAHGVLETHDKSLYAMAVWANVGERMRDKETMEPLITSSGLNWTIVRPPKLSDHAASGKYRTGTNLPIRLWSSIGRADLAAFLVTEAEAPQYSHACPRIAR
ncbi:NAD(P)-dependent oxidoreductase [Streptomyces sp. NPDC057621]|uniref:NAD(P)-dependent oxidoreductase n=1 Tax=Streptomyces sp. NPDC057621 TaxID=3346186 RepID=UPI0036BF5983